MSLVVAVAISVGDGDSTYVNVTRGESVLPATAPDPDGEITQSDVDLVDLARAALDRLTAEASAIADGQVVQLRELLGEAAR